MMRALALALVAVPLLGGLALTACPLPGPVVPIADADAAPGPTLDAGPCAAACAALTAVGCPQLDDCADVLLRVEGDRLVRTSSGAPLTCAAVAAVRSRADLVALGIGCAP